MIVVMVMDGLNALPDVKIITEHMLNNFEQKFALIQMQLKK
jgi:hypothetical protein